MIAPGPARARETGSTLVASVGGLVVFIAFLLLATQVAVGLWARSTLTAVAHDAASRVAGERAEDRRAAAHDEEGRARRILGRFAERVDFTWSQTADDVVVHVHAEALRFVPPPLRAAPGLDEIHRTVRVRIERER